MGHEETMLTKTMYILLFSTFFEEKKKQLRENNNLRIWEFSFGKIQEKEEWSRLSFQSFDWDQFIQPQMLQDTRRGRFKGATALYFFFPSWCGYQEGDLQGGTALHFFFPSWCLLPALRGQIQKKVTKWLPDSRAIWSPELILFHMSVVFTWLSLNCALHNKTVVMFQKQA